MIRKEDVVEIGRFAKPHGIKGEITLNFTSDIFDRVECEYLIGEIEGILVPFFVEEYRFKNDTVALIKLEGVDNEAAAKEFAGVPVYFPKELFGEEELNGADSWDYFVGFRVTDARYGELGEVVAVDESTANVLLQVAEGGKEWLVPAAEELFDDIDHENKMLYMNLPEGLIDPGRAHECF
ncbi:MAG: ribosome maturation factor RimM [Parabacteroides sp.]|nr:ribosome maturation factor RimM [Parabacteroides sp.]